MKNFNLLSKMCSPLVGSQSCEVGFDCRLTVGSPSGLDAKWKQNPFMRFAVVLTLIFTIGSGNVWGANVAVGDTLIIENFASGTTSTTWADIGSTYNYSASRSSITMKVSGDASSISLGASDAKVVNPSSTPSNMVASHVWLNKSTDGYIEIDNIPLHNVTKFQAHWAQSAKVAVTFYYKFNGDASWTSGGASSAAANADATSNAITVTSGKTSVSIKFQRANNPTNQRLDKVHLVVTQVAATKTLSSIAITTAPSTTKYLVGDTFSKTGAVVTATYSDKTTANVSASTTWTSTALTSGSNTITASYTEGGVTKTATTTVTAYTVTVNKVDEDGTAIADAGVTASCTGRILSQSVGSTNYVFKEWQLTTASGTSISTNSITGTPTGNVEVNAVFYKPITITYKANGSTFTTQTYARGGTLAFPASNPDGATYSCTGKTFVGWVGEANKDYSDASTPPTYATAGGSVTAAATYYAVFATASGGGGYEQVTSLSSIHEGSAYFAYYGSYSGTRWYGVNAVNTVIAPVDVTTGVLTTSKTGDGAYTLQEFTLVAVDASNYEYYIKIGNKYVTASGDKTDLSVGNDAYLWKFNSINSTNYNLEILHDASTDYYIKVGVGSATGGKFRSYTSSGQQVSLFQSSTTYSNYATTCCTPLGSINGSVKVISGTSATLQWDVLSGVDGTTPYSVSVSPSEGTSVGGISTVDGRKNCTISGLTAGTEYTFTINAFGDGSHCDKSQDIVATTPKITLGSASGTSTYIEGSGPGSKQTFTVTAVGLTGDLTVTAPTNFEVCDTEDGTYASSKTLTATSGAVSTTVYFRLVTGKTAASSPYAGSVTVSGGSATSQTVAVNGTVSQACHTPTISGQPAASASYNMNVTATALSVTAAKGDVSDPTLTYQWYSNTANSKTTPEPSPIDGATSSSYTPPTTATGTKYYFCEVSSGACSLTSSISAITVNTPSLTVSETARAFGDREVNAGPYTMTFTVSGSNLAKDAPITISGASGMFSVDKTSISQTSTGAVSTTTITVTYNPTTTATHNATLTIASTGATSKTVTLSGTGKNAATVKIEIAGSESTISGTRYEGDSYTLPSTAADCPEMGFYGWYKGTYSHATTAPTGANFYLPGATATLTAGENKFYAVYATITPDAANTYTKITSTGELVTGDYLLVAYFSSSYIEAMKNTVNASNYMDEVNVKNYVNNTITPTKVTLESDNSAIRWRITKSSSTITIYNAAVSKYFCGSTGTPALNTTSEDFSYSVTSGNWTLVTNSKTVYYSDQWYVGTPSSAKEIYLFKRDPSIAGPYTTSPSCVTHDLTVVASPVAGGTAMAVKTTLGESKTTTATATPDDHYTFSHWTISGDGSSMSNTSDGKSTDNPVTVTMGTEDATLTAHFTEKEKCTVVFKNNGETESSTTYWLGEHPIAPTLTDGVSNDACDETSDTHYGWTQTTWSNTLEQAAIDAKTAADVKVYAKDATLPAITAGDDGTTITYHAVWAKGSGGTTTISIDGDGLQAVVSSISSGYQSKDFTVGGYTFNGSQVTKCTDSGTAQYWFQLKKNNEKITIPTLPGRITNISSTAIRTATSGNVNTGVYFNSSATTSDAIASETLSSATSFSLDVTGNHTSGYLLFGAATCINQLSVTYSTVSYSKYLTTCCDKNVTLATNSPSHGSITFSPSGTISTCGADAATRQTTMTVTPDAGYYLSTWSTSGVTPASLSTDIAYGSVSNSGAQATTITFNQNTTAGTYTANATFAAILVSSLTLHATKKDNTSATIFDETGTNVALSLYPTEGKTASPADPLGHTVKIEFGAVLPANALNKGYTWSATVNGAAVGWSSNDLATNAVLEFNKSSGKVVAKAAGTAEIIITADDGSGITAKVTITVANVALSTLNVAKSSTTLYVGEAEEIAVTYDPVNTTTKGYTTGSYTYVTVGRSNDKITLTGKAVTPGEPERVTLTSSDAGAKTATIDVTVKPLPQVTFVDNLQGKTDFSNWGSDGVVSSTVTDGVVTHTKPTPSHTDISDPGASYNACERSHLHLVGWIESTWADAHPSATHEQIVGANVSNGAGTFLEAGADLNVETYNGNIYYAVWSQVE